MIKLQMERYDETLMHGFDEDGEYWDVSCLYAPVNEHAASYKVTASSRVSETAAWMELYAKTPEVEEVEGE